MPSTAQTLAMRTLAACLAVAIGAVQCPVGNAAVATVWMATEVHGEVHELGQPADNQQEQDAAGVGGERKPWEDVQARGRYASTRSMKPLLMGFEGT